MSDNETEQQPSTEKKLVARAVFQQEGGTFAVALRDEGKISPAPGITTAQDMDTMNRAWGVTDEERDRLAAWLQAEPEEEPEEEPEGETSSLPYVTVSSKLLFAASFVSAKLGHEATSVLVPPSSEGSEGVMEWQCPHGHDVVDLLWDEEGEISANIYEDHLPRELVFVLLGYFHYHEIDVEVL